MHNFIKRSNSFSIITLKIKKNKFFLKFVNNTIMLLIRNLFVKNIKLLTFF